MHRNLIVILNDNTMSISKNVGSMARYLSYIRTKPGYIKTKNHLESSLQKLPVVGPVIATLLLQVETAGETPVLQYHHLRGYGLCLLRPL